MVMKALKLAGILVAVLSGAALLSVFIGTTLFSEKLFNLYVGRLDKWVTSGAPTSSI